ncbi:hypothetical protein EET67_09715 [Pseudaminobacter arsenicus]|uniref:Uncharacterized protein n=1 Tax=Borborobacter arsenicus TaxID=1851146 RepID=A0A432V6R9_9HYPH|nr:hypothetical protein [Pseudaminobacter arsenicus]RUM97886.1 hypothetical protein EET67_09715 [Pseudaminobacter arsenicus]
MIHQRNYRPECESWPECNCTDHCEVRRFLNIDEPRFGWFEFFMLALLLIGVAALAYAGWPS